MQCRTCRIDSGNFLITSLELFAAAFILVIGAIVLGGGGVHPRVTQTRRDPPKLPVIGRFRHFSSTSASSFCQYFSPWTARSLFNRAERLGLSRRQGRQQHGGLRLDARDLAPGHRAVRQPPFPTLGRRRATATGDHRTGLPHPLHHRITVQHLGMSYGPSPNRRYRHRPAGKGRLLAEHRRGRVVARHPGGRLHRVSDRHRQKRRARYRRQLTTTACARSPPTRR